MAVFKIINNHSKSKASLKRILDYVLQPCKTSETLCSVRYYSSLDLGLGYLQEEPTRRMFQKQHSTQEWGHLHA